MRKISDTWRKTLIAILYFIIDLVSKGLDKEEELVKLLEEREKQLKERINVLDNSLVVLNSQVSERIKLRDNLMSEMADVEFQIDAMMTTEDKPSKHDSLSDDEVVRVNL